MANWLQSYSEPKSFEWHNCTITKILPSAVCKTTVVVTKNDATTTNKSTTQVLLVSLKLEPGVYRQWIPSRIRKSVFEAHFQMKSCCSFLKPPRLTITGRLSSRMGLCGVAFSLQQLQYRISAVLPHESMLSRSRSPYRALILTGARCSTSWGGSMILKRF
jgi:hypothetical protein